MPMIVQYVDYFLAKRKADTFFLRLADPADAKTLPVHEKWMAANGVHMEMAAPLGLMEGESGIYFVDFADLDDPRLKAYCGRFENPDGESKQPGKYQMVLYPYDRWVDEGGKRKYEEFLAHMEDKDF